MHPLELTPPPHRRRTHMGGRDVIGVVVLACLLAASTCGCSRQHEYRTRLADGERVAVRAPVVMDDRHIGYVKAIRVEAGERVAVLAVTDPEAAQNGLNAGVVRVIKNGHITLRSDGGKADAMAIAPGTFIPSKHSIQDTVGRLGTSQLLALCGIAGAVLVGVFFILKSASRFGMLVLALSLAAITGWAVYPHLVPLVQKFYQSMPDASQAEQNASKDAGAAPESQSTVLQLESLERRTLQVIQRRPDARVVAFAWAFTMALLLYALLLGKAARVLHSRTAAA